MKLVQLFLITMIVAGLLAGCSKKEEPTPAAPTEAKLGQQAAALEGLTYIKGDSVTFEEGKVYVVEFWATWCPPCRTSIPHLTEIQKQFKDNGVTVIGISNEKEIEKVKSFVAEQGEKMNYTVALDTEGKASNGYMKAFKRGGIPAAFVVDAKGKVAWVGHPMDGLDEALKQAVAETGQAIPIATAKPAPTPEPKPAPVEVPAANLGDKAASLDGLTMIKGDPVSFADGKVYVVEFWATWCGPCRTSIPHLTEVQKKFADKGVTVIGISNENDLEKVKGFVAEQGEKMEYTVAMDPKRTVSAGYMTAYKQRGIPTAFIVNGKGKVAWVGHPMSGMDEVLEEVIAGTFDSAAYAKAKAEKKAAEEELGKLFQKYVTDLSGGVGIEATRPTAEKIMESDNPMALNALAWQIMSIPNVDDANRDMETALKAATKANTETNGEDPMILDTYALALSKTGKLEEAIAAQEKAITLAAGNERMQADMKIRMEAMKKSLTGETEEPLAEDAAALGAPVE